MEYKITCDVCGHVTVFDSFTEACLIAKERTINGKKVDLCDQCADNYDSWMAEVQERWLEDGKSN